MGILSRVIIRMQGSRRSWFLWEANLTMIIRATTSLRFDYVDDVLLPGPEHLHAPFWTDLQKYIAIEEPTPVDGCLGRNHLVKREGGGFDMQDFILQSCEAYTSLTGQNLKEAVSRYVADGSWCETDCSSQGQLEGSASKVLMKLPWLARLARPDLMKGICDL